MVPDAARQSLTFCLSLPRSSHNHSLTLHYVLPMSNLISSFIIAPVVRHARRFSGAASQAEEAGRLSHVNAADLHSPSSPPAILEDDGDGDADAENRRSAPVMPFEQSRHSIRRRQSTVEDDGSVHEPEPSISLPAPSPSAAVDIPAMSSNPSHAIDTQLQYLSLDPLRPTTPVTAIATTQSEGSSNEGQNVVAMSESLPADDVMRPLRERMHQIRDLRIADEEKAQMMHSLMTERYNCLRPTSPSSFVSNDRPFTPTSSKSIFSEAHISSPISTASEIDPENPFNLRPGDTNPTYRIRSSHPGVDNNGEDEDFDTAEDGSSFGCQHYKRNVKVQCHQCRRWYTCRHCHDAVEDHNLNRKSTQNMLCMACGTPQAAGEHCVQCGTQAAWYYCHICKLWDDNSSKKIYHCMDCGICRRGAGLGKDYIHCKVGHRVLWFDELLT